MRRRFVGCLSGKTDPRTGHDAGEIPKDPQREEIGRVIDRNEVLADESRDDQQIHEIHSVRRPERVPVARIHEEQVALAHLEDRGVHLMVALTFRDEDELEEIVFVLLFPRRAAMVKHGDLLDSAGKIKTLV